MATTSSAAQAEMTRVGIPCELQVSTFQQHFVMLKTIFSIQPKGKLSRKDHKNSFYLSGCTIHYVSSLTTCHTVAEPKDRDYLEEKGRVDLWTSRPACLAVKLQGSSG